MRYDVARLDETERSALTARIQRLHQERGDAWVKREVETYLSFYWDDAKIFAVDGRLSVGDLRRTLAAVLRAGGGPLSIDLPPAGDLVIGDHGSAAVTSYEWRSTYRTVDGTDHERLSYETNVWYRRDGYWKIIRMHLTRLQSTPMSRAG